MTCNDFGRSSDPIAHHHIDLSVDLCRSANTDAPGELAIDRWKSEFLSQISHSDFRLRLDSAGIIN